ncbi:MAG TPA: uroporphyrinogen-III synthase [Nostocaceae cyanobacterium]|nr:uroporphyrinogen-III synthase [Nostocaceae cyanobacterium]
MNIDLIADQLLIPTIDLPLYGKRIVVTAPRNYAARFAEQIIKKGGLPMLMPTIETYSLVDYTELDDTLKNIDDFDWILFTSRNGIAGFFQRLNALNLPISVLQNCQLAAIGKDAESLLSICGRVDLIPAEPSPVGMVTELGKLPNIQGKKILVPAPKVVGITEPNVIPNLVSDLQKLSVHVTRVPVYITQAVNKNIYPVELNLIQQGLIDIIAFSSTAEVESFMNMFNSKNDYENCVFACFGPYTSANAKKLGIKVAITSKDFSSFEGFVEAIANAYQM